MTDEENWGGVPVEEDWGGTPVETGVSKPTFSPDESTLSKAGKSFIPSLKQFGSDIVQPILHPIDTATSLKNLGLGITEKLGITSGTEHEVYADALAQHFKDRYGSIENAKRTFETDPVGFMSDASMILTGGGTAALKAPGLIGKVGKVAKTVGEYTDPVSLVSKSLSKTGELAGEAGAGLAGLKTHAGAQSFKEAYQAGLEGGERLKSYYNFEPEQLIADAQKSISKMAEARGKDYIERMAPILQSEQVLDFNKIIDKTAEAENMLKFKGEDKATRNMKRSMKKMVDEVVNWGAKDPAEFHTPAGMDALKQKLWYYVKEQPYGSPQRKAALDVYHAVKKEITGQFPAYAEHMKAYEDATHLIDDIEGSLSLGKRGSADAALRKLQTILKRDINPTFENRAKLAEFLVENGSPYLMTQLAGLAHKPLFSGGLGRISGDITSNAAILLSTMGADPVSGAALLATSSPKIMGNLAVFAGALSKYPSKIPEKTRALYLAGREKRAQEEIPVEGEGMADGGSVLPFTGSSNPKKIYDDDIKDFVIVEEKPETVTDKMAKARSKEKSDIPYLPSEGYLKAVKQFEGFTPKAEWDIKQHSVGYGSRAKYPGEEITREEAENRFRDEMQHAGSLVNKFKYDMPEPWKAALTSLTYNAGSAWMNSGLGEAVKKGDWNKARNIFLTYNKAEGKVNKGLQNRRIAEMEWLKKQPKMQVAQGQTPAILQSRPETDQVQLARMAAEAAQSESQPSTADQQDLTNLVKETATPVVKKPKLSPEDEEKFLQAIQGFMQGQKELPSSPPPPLATPQAPRPEIPIAMPYGRAQGGGISDLPGGSVEDYLYMPEMEQGSPIEGSMAPKEANLSGSFGGSLGPFSGNIGGYAYKSGPMMGGDISNVSIQYNPDEDTTFGGEYYKEGPDGFGVMGRGSIRYAMGGSVTDKMHKARKKKEVGGAAVSEDDAGNYYDASGKIIGNKFKQQPQQPTEQPLKERGTFVPLGVTQDDKIQFAMPSVIKEPIESWKRMVDRGAIDLNDPEALRQQAVDAFNVASATGAGSGALTPLKPKGSVGLFGGEIAASRSPELAEKLTKAKIMAKNGLPREQIWNETGFFQGPDKNWRFEINDKEAAFKGLIPGQEVGGKLAELIKHPEAYKNYPELAYLESVYGPPNAGMSPKANYSVLGYYDPTEANRMLMFSGKDPGTALHEMQHAIQQREGLPFGGSAENLDYNRLMGEVEARAVQRRMNLTPEERKLYRPWEQGEYGYDVPEKDILMGSIAPKLQSKGGSVTDKMKKAKQLNQACWEGYKAVGVKTKKGKTVPNCVPIKKKKNG